MSLIVKHIILTVDAAITECSSIHYSRKDIMENKDKIEHSKFISNVLLKSVSTNNFEYIGYYYFDKTYNLYVYRECTKTRKKNIFPLNLETLQEITRESKTFIGNLWIVKLNKMTYYPSNLSESEWNNYNRKISNSKPSSVSLPPVAAVEEAVEVVEEEEEEEDIETDRKSVV